MTAPSSIDPTRFLHEQLGSASPDLLRHIALSDTFYTIANPAPDKTASVEEASR